MATKTLSKCPTCGYPIKTTYDGEETQCAYCGEYLITQGITVPTPLFWSLVAFGIGVLVGPALISTTAGGRRWLEDQAKRI